MEIERVNGYKDSRFSSKVLHQHGCFLVEGKPYEIEILSSHSAAVRGKNPDVFSELIDEFRFYAPHITHFVDDYGDTILRLSPVERKKVHLAQIQPSQFYVDSEKLKAVETFLTSWEDIVIPVLPVGERYIALDGHTRLYCAVTRHWDTVYVVPDTAGDYIHDFVQEAKRRGITCPQDLQLLDHGEYDLKWNQYCDEYFSKIAASQEDSK